MFRFCYSNRIGAARRTVIQHEQSSYNKKLSKSKAYKKSIALLIYQIDDIKKNENVNLNVLFQSCWIYILLELTIYTVILVANKVIANIQRGKILNAIFSVKIIFK